MRLGKRPSFALANMLVIKSQQHLTQPPAAAAADEPLLVGGVPADVLTGALWACAAAGLRLAPAWQGAVVKQLAAGAARLPVAACYQAACAAVAWGMRPPPRPLLEALASTCSQQPAAAAELQQLVASEPHRSILEQLQPYLPCASPQQQQQQQQQQDSGSSGVGDVAAKQRRQAATAAAKAVLAQLTSAAQAGAPLASDVQAVVAQNAASVLEYCRVAQAAAGDAFAAAAALGQLLRVQKWAQLLTACGQLHNPQWQAGAQDAAVTELLELAAGCVQGHRGSSSSSTAAALTPAEGAAVLVALHRLGLAADPLWVAALMAQLNAAANTKGAAKAWLKSAGDAVAYLQAVDSHTQALSLQQCSVVCSHVTAGDRLQQLPLPQLAQLVVLLTAQLHKYTGSSTGASSAAAYRHHVVHACACALVALLPAAGALPAHAALQLVRSIDSLRLRLQQLAEATAGNRAVEGAPAAERAASLHAGALQLLVAAVRALAERSEQVPLKNLLACAALASQLLEPGPDRVQLQVQLLQLQVQLLQLLLHTVTASKLAWASCDAARAFCAAAQLALATDPGLQQVTAKPDPQLGGALLQLLGDAAADWPGVAAPELAALPRAARGVKLPVPAAGVYAAAVQQRLQAMAAWTASELAAAGQAGGGPVPLLHAVCWLAMEDRPGEAGDTSFSGLDEALVADDAGSAAQHGDSDGDGLLVLPAAMFTAVAGMMSASAVDALPVGQVADLAHTLTAAYRFSELQQPAQAAIWRRLGQPAALFGLTPAQHLALLGVAAQQQTCEYAAVQMAPSDAGSAGYAHSAALLKVRR
jgi:hypothetical protein